MEELPIVSFGKYKDKTIIELLADKTYTEWLKTQSWFSNHKTIYNIVVNQQVPNNNSKTPEHNILQNYFLDDNKRIKIIKNVNYYEINTKKKLIKLLNNENFIKFFGIYNIDDIFIPQYSSDVEFEGIYNWDLIIKNIKINGLNFNFIINSQNNEEIKLQFKNKYDEEEKKIYQNKLKKFEEQIFEAEKCCEKFSEQIDADIKFRSEYDDLMKKKYDEDIKNYYENFEKNLQDLNDYKDKFKKWEDAKNEKKGEILKKFKISVDEYEKISFISIWNIGKNLKLLSKLNLSTIKEAQIFIEYINKMLSDSLKNYNEENPEPKKIILLERPNEYNSDEKIFKDGKYISSLNELKNKTLENSIKNEKKIKFLKSEKEDYIQTFYKNYDENFTKSYKTFRINQIKEIFSDFIRGEQDDEDETFFDDKVKLNICYYARSDIYCEIKPLLSDDYPNVLRKMKNQIKLTKESKKKGIYVLIVKDFVSDTVNKEQLIKIFEDSDINIIFVNENKNENENQIINQIEYNGTDNYVKLIKELKDNLEKEKILNKELIIENEELKNKNQELINKIEEIKKQKNP
jgi:hypothetical protein